MKLIELPSHPVAVYMQGDPNAQKLALALPGKLDAKDYAHMRSHVDALAARGYLALSFDPPGTWESPGDISLYTFDNYLNAIKELIKHFGDKPTLLLGHSRGGGMAALAGTMLEKVTAFISIMGGMYPSEHWTTPDNKLSKRDIPFSNPVRYREYNMSHLFLDLKRVKDLSKEFASCTKPKLFFLGTEDVMVTPEEVLKNYEQFAEPKELYKLAYHHDYRDNPEKVAEVNRVINKFLDTFNL